MAYEVENSMIDTSQKGVVKFTGEAGVQLANSLIQKQSKTLEEVSSIGVNVKLEEISVATKMAVEIKNEDFYKEVTEKLNQEALVATALFNINCICL